MQKQTVVNHFGTQAKVAEFIGKTRGKHFARTSVVMWPDPIPTKWALFLDKHTDLKFRKELYQ